MKNPFKLLGLTLALSALVFSGCKKKPIRGADTLPSMGGPSPVAAAFCS